MNIGILTHCVANNFGANLQALSTGYYLKNHGYYPIYICWSSYLKTKNNIGGMMPEQMEQHATFLKRCGFEVSEPCETNEDFQTLFEKRNIRAVIVGADAVLTVQSGNGQLIIGRKGIRYIPTQEDYKFPNPFWLPFLEGDSVKRILMSPSCQSSNYKKMTKVQQAGMGNQLMKFDFVSARDAYTKRMISDLTNGQIDCSITPDPVFNYPINVPQSMTKEEVLSKFNLPENYILVSFFDYSCPKQKWFDNIKKYAESKGLHCVHLPMPECPINKGFDYEIKLPLDTSDWYNLIKHARGYIGNNMHPIIVSIVNYTPFFSLDQHGKYIFRGKMQIDKTGKVYELLESLNLLDHRIAVKFVNKYPVEKIIDSIINFNCSILKTAHEIMREKYDNMMNEILRIIEE